MISEKNYRMSLFEEKFAKYKNKRIFIYGTGINAQSIVERYEDYNIVAFISKADIGNYMCGKLIVSLEQAIIMRADIIIVAAQINALPAIANRIAVTCKLHGIHLVDMYGQDMIEMYYQVLEDRIEYNNLTVQKVKEKIEKNEVLGININNTLFMRKFVFYEELFYDIQEEAAARGIDVPNYREVREKYNAKKEYYSLEQLNCEIGKKLGLDSDDIQKLYEIVLDVEGASFVLREDVYKLMKYAHEIGKTVFLISDLKMSGKEIERILNKWGVKYFDEILIEDGLNLKKDKGLFRFIREKIGEKSYLHLGDNELLDGIAPRLYGYQSIVLRSGLELLKLEYPQIFTDMVMTKSFYRSKMVEIMCEYYQSPFIDKLVARNLRADDMRSIRQMEAENDTNDSLTYIPELLPEIIPKEKIEEYEALSFDVVDQPEVSIVIPVYNQFEYTYNCLLSIKKNTVGCTYEVIVADDCSTDNVRELEKIVTGANIIHNKKNLKFLLNCNNAANQAKGKYILFLNNDTQVQPNWLRPMIMLMEEQPDIGMTGSKLLFPNGRLQEAGGIIWKDASAWNYGRGKNPDKPEFNYIKDVDYISGASIMIRRELWEKIGGFDVRYVPAYYEDSDLAFMVRQQGFRVVYQPQSVVVHFEGISNGTDTNQGLKAYQVENRQKFAEKWAAVLKEEHCENATNVFVARERSAKKHTLLMVDHYIPTFDKDAGSRTLYQYLKLFVQKGYNVKLIGDNFFKSEPYTTIYEQMGIEVLCGPYYMKNWQDWLFENGQFIDYVFLSRPHIAEKYIDCIRNFTHAKIIYYGMDLHYLREQRNYEATGDEEALNRSRDWKKKEFELLKKVDMAYYLSDVEINEIRKVDKSIPLRRNPINIFENIDTPRYIAEKRRDIMFVGGFGHTPNTDAVKWMLDEILPALLVKHPDMKLHIVGSNPPAEILERANENIIVHGFVSDEELDGLYAGIRMIIVPLRFGAGIKGKVVEAMKNKIPLVTTSIGIEGIEGTEDFVMVRDSAKEIVDIILELYDDFAVLDRISKEEEKYVYDNYSVDSAIRILGQDFEF